MSIDVLEKMAAILQNKVTSRHSYFQLKYFVIGKEPTHQSRLWQCLRELKSRHDSIKAIVLEIDDTNDKLELLHIEEERLKLKEYTYQSLDDRERDIKLRRLIRQQTAILENITQLQEKLKNNEEEARFFIQTFEDLEKIDKIKPFDDLESQKEYWNAKLTQDINMRILLQNPVEAELMKTVLALNNDAPIKQQTLHILDNGRKKLQELAR